MLPINKKYNDSSQKSNDSVSNTDFKIDLPVNISLLPHTCFLRHIRSSISALIYDRSGEK